MARRLLALLGRLAFLGLLVVVFAVSAYVAFSLFVRRGVTSVPELAGLTEDEARALLVEQGLNARRSAVGTSYSESVAAGRVLSSQPRAGSFVKRGSTVDLTLSQGAQRLPVPDLGGQALAAAQVTLAGEGLGLGRVLSVMSSRGAPGTVIEQTPAAGADVPAGTAIDVLVALDATPETFVMPDLVYRRFAPVEQYFSQGGFRVGPVKYEPYEGIGDGVILRQQPLPGHPLRRHDSIALVVSVGPGGATR
ncbi:MAG: PASTA domain-containing protein [Thermoanaerobaculia bacterium]